ncbi:MAG: Rrf2 family transcriptional regulator [Nitrospira sp.]|nr:Rrf2 family transcriptional regulator [Nitrospira sp.]
MKVSKRALYGILAVIDLAMHAKDMPVRARTIARRQAIPLKFLEQVLSTMKKAGVIQSVRGAQGGYMLLKEPRALSVADILQVLDGPVAAPASTNGIASRPPLSQQEVLLGHIWRRVAQAEQEVLQQITVDQLVERQRELEEHYAPMYHI